jgi:hypothetical protein
MHLRTVCSVLLLCLVPSAPGCLPMADAGPRAKFPAYRCAEELAPLAGDVTYLSIRGLPDEDVAALSRFRSLEYVDFHGGWKVRPLRMTGAGFRALADLRLPQIKTIELSHAPTVDDACLQAIADIPTIEKLVLTRCRGFTLEGLRPALGHDLRQLKLMACDQVDDAWVDDLGECESLRYLGVSGTRVSPTGVERLKRALPLCHVEVDNIRWASHNW